MEAQLPFRFSGGDARCLILGSRRGGRRYRSEDLDDLRRLGATVVEQVERFRAEELRRLVNQAELRALQAQINPHFLFNALNTLYGTIDRGSRDARRMVINLAEIFRYFLRGHQAVIPLSEELRIVEAYLEIEALRLGDRLETELAVSDSVRSALIPILSIQPLVENAVKHGVAPKQGPGRVCVRAEKVPDGLRVTIEDTGIGFERSQTRPQDGMGLGLENVRRRLSLCHGPSAKLQIQSNNAGTAVSFLIPDASPTEYTSGDLEVEPDPLIT
jgi:two-component system LytT family sensor kinase